MIHIAHLYPRSMSTYGDSGNIRCLVKRCQWRGVEVVVHGLEIGDNIPAEVDLYFFGGGQDAAQARLAEDLREVKGPRLVQDVKEGVPLLSICGGYQLLGEGYLPFEGEMLCGLELFPAVTRASRHRMIGNLIVRTNPELPFAAAAPYLVGFENHSGETELKSGSDLGAVLVGFGNNYQDRQEGCVVNNAIGCYLHGPLLPKNPELADWLLLTALQRKEPGAVLKELDNAVEDAAREAVLQRHKIIR